MKTKKQIQKGCGISWKDKENGIFLFCIGVGKARVLCPTCKALLKQLEGFEKLIDKITNITAIQIGEEAKDTLIDPEELKKEIKGK